MVGRIEYRGEKGRGSGLKLDYIGPLSVLTATLWEPPGLSSRRLERRIARLERTLARQGVGRVVLPEGFPHACRLKTLRPVETLPFYRAVADVLALGALDCRGIARSAGRVALSAPWLCPELEGTAERLRTQVRTLVIRVRSEGENYARWLHEQYGLPVTPPSTAADVEVAFGPVGAGESGMTLALYGERAELAGLTVTIPEAKLPADCAQPLLALLWEAGSVDRETLRVTKSAAISAEILVNSDAL